MEEDKKVKHLGEVKKEFTLDEMKNIAHQLQEQLIKTTKELQQSRLEGLYKRLEFLFKVVEFRGVFSNVFFDECVKEIENIMTPQEIETKEEE